MSDMNRNQEQQIVNALLAHDDMPTMDSLNAAGVRTIEGVLGCSSGQAQVILTDLRERNRIEA
jgi:hypothetical protein